MYRNASLCLVDATPAPVAGGPLRPKAPDRLRMAADREGLPPGPLRPVGLGSANGAPRARPLPPQPPGHGGTGRLIPPHTPMRGSWQRSPRRAVAGCGPPCARGGIRGLHPVCRRRCPGTASQAAAALALGAPCAPARLGSPPPPAPLPAAGAAGRGAPLAALATARAPQFPGPGGPGYKARPTGRPASLNFAFSARGGSITTLALNGKFSEIGGP